MSVQSLYAGMLALCVVALSVADQGSIAAANVTDSEVSTKDVVASVGDDVVNTLDYVSESQELGEVEVSHVSWNPNRNYRRTNSRPNSRRRRGYRSGKNRGLPGGLPGGRRYYNGRYFGNFNNRYYGPQYGYF